MRVKLFNLAQVTSDYIVSTTIYFAKSKVLYFVTHEAQNEAMFYTCSSVLHILDTANNMPTFRFNILLFEEMMLDLISLIYKLPCATTVEYLVQGRKYNVENIK